MTDTLDISTMAKFGSLRLWVESWPEEDWRFLAESGYDDWERAPYPPEVRRIYMAYKIEIWNIVSAASGSLDACSWLFDPDGYNRYMADDENEFLTALVGVAIEEIARDIERKHGRREVYGT